MFCSKAVCSDNIQIFFQYSFLLSFFVINLCALLHFKSVLRRGQGARRRNDCCDVTNPVAAEPHVPASLATSPGVRGSASRETYEQSYCPWVGRVAYVSGLHNAR